ncbi:hypothetical protein AB0O28_09470 [Microbispora sp. NPDC088329]|uniref:hypothetical protein n=1 Tax=Microbispora sp. NPDC088329 TaxID=3154869 RepID=UPI0034424AF2
MTTSEDTTQQQRLEQLRSLLAGTRGDSRLGRNLARTQKANVIFGATLHAADRLRQGEQLTELEDTLLQALRVVVPEEELKGWGRIYRETVSVRGTLVGVPEVITSRPVSEGYDFADLVKDLPAVGEEWMAQSNTALITAEALAAGEDFDSPEFIEGMREWGFGVSAPAVLTTPGNGQTAQDAERAEPLRQAYLEFENFHVHRVVGDGWPNTRDEIRWVSGGSSDRRGAEPFLSEEFGGDKATAGKTPAFSVFNRNVFNGSTSTGLILSVACWEWDTGGGGDYDILGLVREMNNNIFLNVAWTLIAQMPGMELLGLLADITSHAVNVADLVNKNDLSSARTLFLDQDVLAVLSHRGSTQWHFNGDGHHELRVKFTGDAVPFPEATLEYAVRTSQGWGAPVALPWKSITPPALASYKGKLYAAFVRSDRAVMWTRLENGKWRTPERVGGDHSYCAPALCVAHNELFYAVTGVNNALYWRRFTESGGWSGVTKFNSYSSGYAPSMAAIPGRLWLTHVGTDGRLYHNTHDGRGWSSPHSSNLDWLVDSPATMAPHGSQQVWRIVRGMDNSLAFSVSGSPTGWRDDVGTGGARGWRITHGPTLTLHDGKLWIFLRAMDNTLLVGTYTDATQWTAPQQVGGQGAIKPKDEVAATSHDGRLYVMYRR